MEKDIDVLRESIIEGKYHLYKEDLKKCVKNVIEDYKRQLEINQEHQKVNGELRQKIKELEDADLTTIYLNGVYDGKHKANEEIKKIKGILNVNIIRAINKNGEIFYNEEACIEIVKQLKDLLERE